MAHHLSTIRRWSLLACALLLVSGVLAACGNSDDSSSTSTAAAQQSTAPATTPAPAADAGGATALAIDAVEGGGDELGFSRRVLTARAGSVTIALTNPGTDRLPHAIAIEGDGVDKDGQVVQPGGRSTVTVRLAPGTYTFYCPVGDHEKDGMKGTLTVS
jgi:plastocyanin